MADISKIKLPNNDEYNIKDETARAGIGNAKVFYGTCATAAATTEKAVTCSSFKSGDLVAGSIITVLFSETNSGAVGSISLNVNSTGAKPIRYIYNGSISTIPGVGYIKTGQAYQFYYDGTYWVVMMAYNTDADWKVRADYGTFTAGSGGLLAYSLVMQRPDGRWESITTTSTTAKTKAKNTHGFLIDSIFYRSTSTTIAENAVDSTWQFSSCNVCDARYHLNIENTDALKLITGKILYLVGTIGSDGLFYLADTWWSQSLPTTNDGKCYIHIGSIFDWYRYNLDVRHPVYKYVNGAVRPILITQNDTATTSAYGITKLNTATNSTSTTEAATPSAVKTAYDLANGANTTANTALSGVNGTLIYDHTYSISNGVATFTPHVYQKGVEVTTSYAASCFVWKYRLIDGSEVTLTTKSDRGCDVTITSMGYGGHVIGAFTPPA